MIALLLAAAAVTAAPPERPFFQRGTLREVTPACQQGRMLVLNRAPPARATKLGDLPKAHLMLPVMRSVEGCAIPTVVRYDVEQDGSFAKSK